jgi:acetyl-CoA C-acetyltransferase
MNKHHFQDEWLHRHRSEIYWPMLQTAEYVAKRYDIPRSRQDEFGVQSQNRAAQARAEGKFKDEIVPITTKMKVVDKNTGHETTKEVTAAEDEGIRPDTTYEGVSQIKPAIEGGCIAAGNASQFSDGASACVVMSGKEAARRNLKPLGIFRGFAAAGCDPKEMGIGPVFAVPKLLQQAGTCQTEIRGTKIRVDLQSVVVGFQCIACLSLVQIGFADVIIDICRVRLKLLDQLHVLNVGVPITLCKGLFRRAVLIA